MASESDEMEKAASEMENEIVRHGKKSQSPDHTNARGSAIRKGKGERVIPVP
jgi:hypothetical protein